MRLRSPVIVSLTCLFLGACVNARTSEKELKKLEGDWEVIGATSYGRSAPRDKIKGNRFVFSKDRLTMIDPDGKKFKEFRVVLDFSQQPRAMDLIGPGSKYSKEEITPAIYELKGDSLRICRSQPSAARRPTAFESERGSRLSLITLKRLRE